MFDSYLRRVPRRGLVGARVQRRAAQRRAAALRASGPGPRRRGDRRAPPGARRRSRRSARARSATSSPGIKDVGEAQGRRDRHRRGAAAREALAGYRDPKPMVFCGLYPGRRRRVRRPARGAREAAAQRLVVHLRARDVGRARLRVPLRLPRPAAHGDRARAARARVRPLARRDRAERRVPARSSTDGARRGRRQPVGDAAAAARSRRSRSRTSRVTILTPTEYVGTLMELSQQRRGEMEKMEYLSEERVELVYVLPLAEIVLDFFDQMKSRTRGLREPRLRAGRVPRVEPRRRSTCCSTTCRSTRSPRSCTATRRTTTASKMTDEAARAHPAPAVRRADPGRDRRAHHRPRDGEGEAQGRDRQVLRRRHHAASASCSSARRKARRR